MSTSAMSEVLYPGNMSIRGFLPGSELLFCNLIRLNRATGHPYKLFLTSSTLCIIWVTGNCGRYWRYSINEHGTKDIPAMIQKIHETKMSELKICNPDIEVESDDQPYKLCAVTHSLGGAALLMYVITRRIEEKDHRLSRLVLLSPAGFHGDSGIVFTLVEHTFMLVAPILEHFVPAFYIPTRFFRMLVNKLARDLTNNPALGGLVQTLMSYVVGGDSSNWVGVLGLSHYNMNDMPGVSFRVALHLAQMKRTGRFIM